MVARLHCSTVSWLHGLTVLRFVFIDSWLHGSCVHGGTIPLFDPPVYAVWFHSLTQFNSSLLHISFKRFLNFTIACHAVARLYGLIHSCTVARSQFHSFCYGYTIRRLYDSFVVPQFHVFRFTVHSLLVPRFQCCTFHGLVVLRCDSTVPWLTVLRLHGFPVASVLR